MQHVFLNVAKLYEAGDAHVLQMVGNHRVGDGLAVVRIQLRERAGLDVGGLDQHAVEIKENRLEARQGGHDRIAEMGGELDGPSTSSRFSSSSRQSSRP